jgi:hypothetical protein
LKTVKIYLKHDGVGFFFVVFVFEKVRVGVDWGVGLEVQTLLCTAASQLQSYELKQIHVI